MKNSLLLLSIAVFTLPAIAQRRNKKDKNEASESSAAVFTLKNASDSLSYAFGVQNAENLRKQKIDSLDYEAFINGTKAVFENKALLNNELAVEIIKNHFAATQRAEGEANKLAGEEFLSANKSKEGVVTLPSGLQYKVLNKSTKNEKPALIDKVKTHYHGTLIDGTVFDSSVDRGEPASFPVSNVIRGWVEALQLMNVGDKWQLFIPYNLAYGARATGKIKPYSALIFEVELLAIEK